MKLRSLLRERFARNVRQFRRMQKMTQGELAEAAGLGREFINRLECGRVSVSLENLVAIAIALDVTPQELLDLVAHPAEL